MNNSEIIQKADLALSDIASAGKLNPDQTDRFIRNLIDAPTMLQNVRTVAMKAPSMKINKIGFGSRILAAAVENTGPTGSKPTMSSISMDTKEVIAKVTLPYAVVEDNIEGGNVNTPLQTGAGGIHSTLVDMIAERVAVDLEELALNGDTANGGDTYLALTDGFIKRMTTNIVDAGNATFSKEVVKSALKAMPTKYLRSRTQMKHFATVGSETEIRDQFANRIGGLGDSNVQGNLPVTVFGSPLVPVALMPANKGFFTNPQNLIFGIWRNVMLEYTKNIETRQFIIVVTARIDFQIEEETACVKYINLAD